MAAERKAAERIMRAFYAAGFIEKGSAEDDPEAAIDLMKYLDLEGLDIVDLAAERKATVERIRAAVAERDERLGLMPSPSLPAILDAEAER